MKKIVIIGSGFSSLAAACFMAKAGWDVTVLEKQDSPGGRARQFISGGFVFDMGPSWYWMPDVFERFFNCFGKKVSDYYELVRLDPSYRIYWKDGPMEIPASYEKLKRIFDKLEPGSAKKLDKFIAGAGYKYQVGMHKLVHKPGRSYKEFIDWEVIKGIFKLDVFTSVKSHVAKYFRHPKLKQLMEFPILFLGALPKDIPALYSLMNYADIKLGTWYPMGGMYKITEGMYLLAKELKVKFHFNQEVIRINVENGIAKSVITHSSDTGMQAMHEKSVNQYVADVVIGGADYHFIETKLLPEKFRSYSTKYWNKRIMAPSCLLYYIGLNKKLNGVSHHSLFFDTDFELHGNEIYCSKKWPSEPLFYVCIPSVTDAAVAPKGCENLFFLVPVASGLEGDTEELRDKYFAQILNRFEEKTNQLIKEAIIVKKTYSISNFVNDYNAYKGNAYGLANTLLQTAVLKPSLQSKKVKNLYFTGQLTVPGPGVPPSLISGEVTAKEIMKQFGKGTGLLD